MVNGRNSLHYHVTHATVILSMSHSCLPPVSVCPSLHLFVNRPRLLFQFHTQNILTNGNGEHMLFELLIWSNSQLFNSLFNLTSHVVLIVCCRWRYHYPSRAHQSSPSRGDSRDDATIKKERIHHRRRRKKRWM